MATSTPDPFWESDPSSWYQKLETSLGGLSTEQAEKRLLLSRKGQKPVSALKKDLLDFAGQFKSPLMLLLISAVILSAFLGDTSDVFIILFIVLSTGTLSFIQERNAGKVVEKLQSLIAHKCSVKRDGAIKEILSADIVPGDILVIHAGDIIPADCLLLESSELQTNESSLTGESFPVRKEPATLPPGTALSQRKNALWEGTSVVSGKASALVIHTGADTIFNNITRNASAATETSFEKGIRNFGYFLMKITLALSAFILVINLLNHKNIIDSALFALALAVGMAPELLPAITTIAMSAGARRLLDRKVIVRKLSSIQNLGEVNLLCTDKTGTITEGTIAVSAILNAYGTPDAFAAELAYWNALYQTGYSNPIDEALTQKKPATLMKAEKTGEIPYDFNRKRLSIQIKNEKEQLIISKGAFGRILEICDKVRQADGSTVDMSKVKDDLERRFAAFGDEGLRVIGLACKPATSETLSLTDEAEMTFAGFILLQDPVKEGTKAIMDDLKAMSIDLKIITGDNRNVARSIALKIGIPEPVILTGEEVSRAAEDALAEMASKTHIFAETEPQQKERIILALRKKHTVAYMGDGINDVAAIHAADVGISVENASDVAREAADFVLTEKDLSVLNEGFREGRRTFANTLKYIYISTGSTFGNMCSVAAASLILPFLPMLPKQILMTNFITDFPYLAVASDNVDSDQTRQPGHWDLKLIRNYMVVFGVHSSLFDLATFLVLLLVVKASESVFQTGWFIESVLSELFILFIIRTHKNFFRSRPNGALFLLSCLGLVLTLSLPYLPFAREIGFAPLPFHVMMMMLSLVVLYIVTADLLKVWFFRKFRKET